MRFKEFKGEWIEREVGSLFNISAGGDIEAKHVSQQQTNTFKYPIYANASEGKGLYGFSDTYKAGPNVITVAGRGVNIGVTHARDHCFYPIVRLLVLKPKVESDIIFFESCINRIAFLKESTGVPQLTSPQISSYKLFHPSLSEQQKIARFLFLLNDRIATQIKIIEELKSLKNALSKKIFSRQIRFKDENGKDFPKWRIEPISDIITNKSSKYDANKEKISYKCIELEHISSGSGQLLGYIDSINAGSIKNKFEKNDVLFGKLRPYLRKYLKAQFSGVCSSEIWVLKGNGLINDFLFYLIQTDKFIDLANKSSGSKMPRADWQLISSKELLVPIKVEQIKIANFLSLIDEKIRLDSEIYGLLAKQKHYLLSNLFI